MTDAPPAALTPEAAYRRALKDREDDLAALERRFNLLSLARAATFLTAIGLLWAALSRGNPPLVWVLGPIGVFAALALLQERVRKQRARGRASVAWYRQGLARLAGEWAGKGTPGERFRDQSHLYAEDLDLFGKGSLFELLCTARTGAGQETLAEWLTAPASPGIVRARQAAVAELRARPRLREDLAVLGTEVDEALHRAALTRWGGAPALSLPAMARPAAAVLAALNLASLAGAAWFGVPPLLVLVSFGVSAAFSLSVRSRVSAIVRGVEAPARGLDTMAALLQRLELERFTSPRLVELRSGLDTQAVPVSRRIARLHQLVGLLDSRRNQLFAPVGALLLWSTQCAFAIEAWRRRNGPDLGGWIDTVGEFEALAALGTYAFEHPDYPFPEMVEGEARLEGAGLAHPLLPSGRAVANDVALGGRLRGLVVSGSNMSGKSTLLRTVGVNVALAQAGAPVRATGMRLSTLAIGASFRTRDSLQEGQSRFYAEIARIRAIMDLLGQGRPVLFLLDELLSGTNSHDRAIGARAIVEHLVAGGAIGMLTTHDLALAGIADALSPRLANVHFEDTLEEGRLLFDYRLRPGVVERSNAIALMRSVGLDVRSGT